MDIERHVLTISRIISFNIPMLKKLIKSLIVTTLFFDISFLLYFIYFDPIVESYCEINKKIMIPISLTILYRWRYRIFWISGFNTLTWDSVVVSIYYTPRNLQATLATVFIELSITAQAYNNHGILHTSN